VISLWVVAAVLKLNCTFHVTPDVTDTVEGKLILKDVKTEESMFEESLAVLFPVTIIEH